MEPTLHDHQRVVETFPPFTALHVGDIVNYRNDFTHQPTVHRIVGGWGKHLVVQGDRNAAPDRGYCTPGNYLGEVVLTGSGK